MKLITSSGVPTIPSVGRFSCRRRFANDASEYKNYLLVMLFVKYVSDSWTEHYEQLQVQYGEDTERILRRLERERFVLPPDCRFDDIIASEMIPTLARLSTRH
jgi:type I restriction-modification system DNA methylase subunit